MEPHDLKRGIARSVNDRAGVSIAIAHLIEEVQRLAVQVNRLAVVIGMPESPLAVEALCAAATTAIEATEHSDLNIVGVANARETECLPFIPQENLAAERGSEGAGPPPVDDMLMKAENGSCGESALAAHVLHLHDRIGELMPPIDSPPSQPSDDAHH